MDTTSQVLFLFAVCWGLLWGTVAGGRPLLVVMVLLGGINWLLAQNGTYHDRTSIPPTQLLVLAPALVLLLSTVVLPQGRRWLQQRNLVWLTMIHILRIPVELVLHQAYLKGLVPQGMTYSGHNFDIVSGITAAFLVAWQLSARPPSRTILIAWSVGCLVLLGIVVVTAVLSIPSTVQRLNFDQPNVLVLDTPYILLPALLVPLVLWAHVAALVRLLRPAAPLAHGVP